MGTKALRRIESERTRRQKQSEERGLSRIQKRELTKEERIRAQFPASVLRPEERRARRSSATSIPIRIPILELVTKIILRRPLEELERVIADGEVDFKISRGRMGMGIGLGLWIWDGDFFGIGTLPHSHKLLPYLRWKKS